MTSRLVKMEGAGNDFLLGTGRWAERLRDDGELVVRLCHRRLGVGADGALSVEMVAPHEIRLVYRNADGSKARFCANGTRCAARAAQELLGGPDTLVVRTDWVPVPAEVRGDAVALTLPVPEEPAEELQLSVAGVTWRGSRLCVGVPHLVVQVADLEGVDVEAVGRELAHHPELAPSGANVTFVTIQGEGVLRLRSFELGVEAETLCCGSGVVAAALLWLAATGGDRVVLEPRSGDRLVLELGAPGEGSCRLSGPARFIADIRPSPGLLQLTPASTKPG